MPHSTALTLSGFDNPRCFQDTLIVAQLQLSKFITANVHPSSPHKMATMVSLLIQNLLGAFSANLDFDIISAIERYSSTSHEKTEDISKGKQLISFWSKFWAKISFPV